MRWKVEIVKYPDRPDRTQGKHHSGVEILRTEGMRPMGVAICIGGTNHLWIWRPPLPPWERR